MKKLFTAVTNGGVIGNGTREDLIKWLERFINTLFPENGIEYFSHSTYDDAKLSVPVPAYGGDDGLRSYACNVKRGHCEGRIIAVNALLKNGQYKEVLWIKTFGDMEECWAIAAAMSEALESIYTFDEIPEIVAFAELVPRRYTWERIADASQKVQIIRTETHLTVKVKCETVWEVDYSDRQDVARFYIEPRLRDWTTVLTNMKATVEIVDMREKAKEVESV